MTVGGPRPLRILAVHRYFWPDTPPYAAMLRDIAMRWARDGHSVEVLSSQPSYKENRETPRQPRRERLDALTVRRVRLLREHGLPGTRLLNIGLFSLRTALHVLFGRRYDVVMTSTAPPVLLAWAASMATRLRGGSFIYHCMDVHPEIGRVSGDFSHPVVFRILQRLDRITCSTAAAVVVLSTDMATTLQGRGRDRRLSPLVINNFELGNGDPTASERNAAPHGDGRLHVVFTGNVGRFQGLGTVIEALNMVQHAKVDLTVMGEGSAIESLREQAATVAGAQVSFLPHQDVATARALIASADLGLVSLIGGIHRYAYPSKTMTYLAEGCPVLAVVEPDCQLSETLQGLRLGVVAPPGNPSELAAVLDRLAVRPAELHALRETARRKGAAVFDKETTLDRWSELMRAVRVHGRGA